MKNLYLISFIFLLSCQKNEANRIIAGQCDVGDYYFEFSQPLELNMQQDSSGKYIIGNDSLDLNFDGIYETKLTHFNWNMDSVQAIHNEPSGPVYPYFYFYGTEIGYSYVVDYCCGSNSTATYYLSIVDSAETIDHSFEWRHWYQQAFFQTNPTTYLSYGPWFYTRKTAYIAYTFDGKLGWLKVDAQDSISPKFMSYCLHK